MSKANVLEDVFIVITLEDTHSITWAINALCEPNVSDFWTNELDEKLNRRELQSQALECAKRELKAVNPDSKLLENFHDSVTSSDACKYLEEKKNKFLFKSNNYKCGEKAWKTAWKLEITTEVLAAETREDVIPSVKSEWIDERRALVNKAFDCFIEDLRNREHDIYDEYDDIILRDLFF